VSFNRCVSQNIPQERASTNDDRSRNYKCSLHLHHIPIFRSSHGYAYDERMAKISRLFGGGLCDVHLGSGTRYMVQYAQDKDQPHDRVLNSTRFNSKLSTAKRERPCFNMLYITNLKQLGCCGYINTTDFVTDTTCTSAFVAAGKSSCVGPFSTIANNYLDVLFTAAFGIVGKLFFRTLARIDLLLITISQALTSLSFWQSLCSSRIVKRRRDIAILMRRMGQAGFD
jgi:hypothetical protein